MKVALIPLDERPVNTRYPQMLATGSAIDVLLPPLDLLSDRRRPADHAGLAQWLQAVAPECSALIVSLEMLGYGGLIASRTTDDPLETILARLALLRTLKMQHPQLQIYGFNLITRISRGDDDFEEPLYWRTFGSRMFRFSQALDRQQQGQPAPELDDLRAQLPPELLADFIERRLRNHSVNLYALQLLYAGVFDVLVLSSDDTSVYGFGSSEKRWIQTWKERLESGHRGGELLLYPGADEVGCVLLARLVNRHYGNAPRFAAHYYDPAGAETVAAFEDAPVRVTVERQIQAAGATLVTSMQDAEIALLINPPLNPDADWPHPYTAEQAQARAGLSIGETFTAPQIISAVADVAHSNGADRVFVERLRQSGAWQHMSAYSAWNTAGNSIGTTVAAAIVAFHAGKNSAFLAHRIIEDVLYQSIARMEVCDWLEAQSGKREPDADQIAMTCAWIEQRLNQLCAEFELAYRVQQVRLPWQRTFEVDFVLQAHEIAAS